MSIVDSSRVRGPVACLLAVGALAASGSEASATHQAYYPILRSSDWRLCLSVAPGDPLTGVYYGISEINRTEVSAGGVPCNQSPNVSISTQYLVAGYFGITSCVSGLSGTGCDVHSVVLNTRTVTTLSQWKKTSTHELGHVAGLGHRTQNGSCMTQGISPPIASTFDLHDLVSINSTYPY